MRHQKIRAALLCSTKWEKEKVSVQSQELLVCRDRNFIFQELLSQLVVRSRKPLLF